MSGWRVVGERAAGWSSSVGLSVPARPYAGSGTRTDLPGLILAPQTPQNRLMWIILDSQHQRHFLGCFILTGAAEGPSSALDGRWGGGHQTLNISYFLLAFDGSKLQRRPEASWDDPSLRIWVMCCQNHLRDARSPSLCRRWEPRGTGTPCRHYLPHHLQPCQLLPHPQNPTCPQRAKNLLKTAGNRGLFGKIIQIGAD